MPAFWSTNWTGTPQLHKIVNVDDGRTHYFFDQAPKARTIEESGFDEDHPGLTRTRQLTGDDGGPSYEDGGYYSGTDINQVRQEWQRQFPGVAFPDASTATLGAGINAQGNGIPGQFSGNEYTERGNSGHGSWLDQQGTEIIGNLLYGGAGYVGGPLATTLLGLGADNSAESQRDMRAAGGGSLVASIFGSPSTSGNNVTDSSTTNYSSTPAGGNTDNYFGDYLTDPNTGDVVSSDGTGVDQYGNPTGQYADSTFTGDTANTGYNYESDPSYLPLAQKFGPAIAKGILGGAGKGGVLGALGAGKQTLGQSILGQLGSDPLSAAFSATPFLLALHEANKQGGDINDTIGRMRSLEDSVSGNASPYMNALLNPYDQQTGTGRAALLQDQGLRGIRGSSFGDQSLNSYDYTRDLGRGDIASKALLGSAGLQGNLMNSELGAINARNTNRNLLLGAGLSASGRLFQPEKDPFNLNTLLGLT
jgi:hypothetical protein